MVSEGSSALFFYVKTVYTNIRNYSCGLLSRIPIFLIYSFSQPIILAGPCGVFVTFVADKNILYEFSLLSRRMVIISLR